MKLKKILFVVNRDFLILDDPAFEICTQLDHPGIMKLYDAIDTGFKVWIINEYINGNNLYQYIRKLHETRIADENTTKKIFKQIVESVAYMHQ